MKNFLIKIYNVVPNFLKGVWGIVLIIVILIGGYFLFKPKAITQYEYETVAKTTFKQTVEGSGNVTTEKEVELKSLSGGQVTQVNVKPGQQVYRGQIIASLDSRSASIQVTQAKASYAKIVNGSTSQQAQVAKIALDNAKASLINIQKQQDSLVANAHRVVLNSGLTALPVGSTITNNPTISGMYTCSEQGVYRITIYGLYGTVSGLEEGTFQISQGNTLQPIGSCGLYISTDSMVNTTSGDQWTITIPNTLSVNYVSSYNSYLSAVQSRDKAVADATQAVASAQASFDQTIAAARPEDIASAQATLDSAHLAYDNTFVRAPFDGQIGTVAVQTGEQVSTGTSIATILTKGKIAEISLNEVDVAQVRVGQKVDLSFDAVNGLLLMGTVSEIDTLGTANQNVITFKVKIAFDQDDERIKPGMSVTGDIVLQEKPDVLLVSNGTLKSIKGTNFVQVLDTNSVDPKNPNKQVPVELGLSNDTSTEIVSGLNVGDKVVVRIVPTSSVATTTSSGGAKSPFMRTK